MKKPTGKLLFAYQSIANLETKLATAQAEARELREKLGRVEETVGLVMRLAEQEALRRSGPKRTEAFAQVKALYDALSQPAAQEADLPLMARRPWMLDGADYFVVHGDMALEVKSFQGQAPYYDDDGSLYVVGDTVPRDEVGAPNLPDGIYRIADTDENDLKVVERTADMPACAEYRYRLSSHAGWKHADTYDRAVGYGWQRIEDYQHGQEG